MVILTNCLAEKSDEGCVKVANSLIKRIKDAGATTVISYDRKSEKSDVHLKLNKLFLNVSLFKYIHTKKEPILYVPYSACTAATIFRILVLTIFGRVRVNVLFVAHNELPCCCWKLLHLSRAKIFTISKESYFFFKNVTDNQTVYLKTGVDLDKFYPVDKTQKNKLRQKLGIAGDAKVVLHVGHLKEGRNIRTLLNIDDSFHILLVLSPHTETQRDVCLRAELEKHQNITIIDWFVDKIEHVYQASDVYLFPVIERGNCIDAPLSVLEAAACGIPTVVTAYGELKELINKDGFYKIESFECGALNEILVRAYSEKKSGRKNILDYDWGCTVKNLLSNME